MPNMKQIMTKSESITFKEVVGFGVNFLATWESVQSKFGCKQQTSMPNMTWIMTESENITAKEVVRFEVDFPTTQE